MSGSNRIPHHMQWMGALVMNLQSFEFALRGFLYNCEKQWTNQGRPDFLESVTEGRQLEENAFTNYDPLAKLIKKYNAKVRPRDAGLAVDPGISRIRDARTHGRIAGLSPSLNETLRLVKYDKPANRLVQVTDFHVLTKEWFDEQGKLVAESIKKVLNADALFRSKA